MEELQKSKRKQNSASLFVKCVLILSRLKKILGISELIRNAYTPLLTHLCLHTSGPPEVIQEIHVLGVSSNAEMQIIHVRIWPGKVKTRTLKE